MGNYRKGLHLIVGRLFIATALVLVSWAAQAVPGPLERSAQASEHAERSVLVALTRAGTRLVAVGERGIVLLSDDNGSSWRQGQVPVSVTLTAVQFINAKEGWVVGHAGVVLHSRDGGETWERQLDGKQAAELVLKVSQANQLDKVGDPDLLDRELRDAQRLVAEGPDKPFLSLHFMNEQSGYVIGAYNLIFRTDDGGKTWQPWQSHIDNSQGLHLYSIRSSGSDLYVVGEQGSLFRSEDSGEKFVAVETPYIGSYFDLLTGDSGELVIFGLRGNAYRSDDNGSNWKKVETESNSSITDGVKLNDGRLVLVNQSGQLLVSEDHGVSFRLAPISQLSPLAGITQIENGDLIVVGLRGASKISLPTVAGSAE